MPLPLLLTLVIGGITMVVILLHLLGYSKRLHLESEAIIRREWARHFPEDQVNAAHLSADTLSALVETDHGPGLLWVMGADSTAHRAEDVTVTERDDGLTIDLHDFAAPGLTVRLPADARALWRQKLTEHA
ncbi:hypothetical protein GTA62_12150 [Roseobacter sp. HKCCD9010]|uniref:hypothetical protein n=1 Tax=unclassified Roseobacter TaxID=196798 RepID=UPI0014919A82|nr:MULTISPECIES: hypothetical protein [unclassified Roseobacter]MBF9050064.1 hypothetical protein [Rhodobacterales bacterium HKCCD4356]NNV12307.1 hypothetical protein [Roseobacter sp. HKCCD7357]NNV16230.1 hypothetical protein [Roseobacter sp. HKCCD8768]NNV25690.1 hypothetical protein [Roseobacter sp. HKCCD8192]NNV29946.1 hypothetical protein [Roseobacter sp. HKCCD9061]